MKSLIVTIIICISLQNYLKAQFGLLVDPRDGKTYKTQRISGYTWMAENLNYETKEYFSKCNNDQNFWEDDCKTFGRLYTWDAAMHACPPGWYLPSISEIRRLSRKYHYIKGDGIYSAINLWSSSANSKKNATKWELDVSDPDIIITKTPVINKFNMLPVRCVKDPTIPTPKPEIDWADIPGGTIFMGSENQFKVSISPFKMSKYEITVEQYAIFCEVTGRDMPNIDFKNPSHPIHLVSWFDAVEFAKWVGARLPTSAEWVYAYLGGTELTSGTDDTLTFSTGNVNSWRIDEVGSYEPNAFGLHDMSGNISEWCSDWYGERIVSDTIDPKGPDFGEERVIHGCDFATSDPGFINCVFRRGSKPNNRYLNYGFRLVKIE